MEHGPARFFLYSGPVARYPLSHFACHAWVSIGSTAARHIEQGSSAHHFLPRDCNTARSDGTDRLLILEVHPLDLQGLRVITTTFLFGLSSFNSAAIFAMGLGLIGKMAFFERNPEELSWFRELVDWNSSLKQEATRIAEKYLLARNERTQISQPCFKRPTICPPRRTRGLNHIVKRSRTDWIKQDVASLQELQSFFSVQKATTLSPLRFARRTANPVVHNATIQTLVDSPVSINSLLRSSVRMSRLTCLCGDFEFYQYILYY
ncbi:hypothetical protein EDB83DRAFT_455 [Lactarius deliciosus]|nr:hypothetical protein EDB83DRAFT_455 [Lactarius deliciosus]